MIVVQKGHRVSLGEQYEMGEGVESYEPSCDCGWLGVPVDTHAHPRYGDRAQTPLKGHIGGDHHTALLQVLIHVDYDPKQDEALYREGMEGLLKEFFTAEAKSLTYNAVDLQARALERCVRELQDVRYRQMVWSKAHG